MYMAVRNYDQRVRKFLIEKKTCLGNFLCSVFVLEGPLRKNDMALVVGRKSPAALL